MVQNVLEIPELRLMVIDFLRGDGKALLSAMLVNKTWKAEVIGILWKRADVQDLAPIFPLNRGQYAQCIQQLLVDNNVPVSTHVELNYYNLEFPRLKTLLFVDPEDPFEINEEYSLAQYLSPNLREIIYNVRTLGEDVYYLLETCCPRLEKAEVWSDYYVESMISFLQNCTSLKSLHFSGNLKEPLDNRLLSCLARRQGLECLHMIPNVNSENVDKMFEGTAVPFRDVKDLRIGTVSSIVPKLMNNMEMSMPGLRFFDLWIEDTTISPLLYVSWLSNLRKLTITCTEKSAEWGARGYVALKNLTNLNALHIYSHYLTPHYCEDLTNDDFNTMFKDMKQLEWLTFQVSCPLITTDALTSLGESCRHLAYCEMPASFDFADWWDVTSHPLFPELRELILGRPVDREEGPW